MPLHGLIDIHCGKAWHVESREPHIHHDGNLHRRVVFCLKQSCILLILLRLNHVGPIRIIRIGGTRHHMHLLRPFWAHLQQLTIDLHCRILIVGHNHRLTCQFMLAVLLVMLHDIGTQTGDGIRMTEYLTQPTIILTRLVDLLFGSTLASQLVKLIIQFLQGLFVQVQINHTALIIHRSGGSVSHCLRHIIHIDIITKHLLGVPVALRDRCTRKAYKRGMWQGFAHQLGIALLHFLGLGIPVFLAILRTMGLIGYHDDIATIREQPRTLLKLLNGRKDDATCLQVFQFAHQVLSPTRLGEFTLLVQVETHALWLLSQKLLATSKLLVQLLV